MCSLVIYVGQNKYTESANWYAKWSPGKSYRLFKRSRMWWNSPVTVINGISKTGCVIYGEAKYDSVFFYQNLRCFNLK